MVKVRFKDEEETEKWKVKKSMKEEEKGRGGERGKVRGREGEE